ncbi:MAG TPA: dual specificity protein phosphatase family protein [Chloroflexota bacterium]|nr:dual specificity protein phosphatase family protein [Chloroflexota bacterium]
MHNFRWQVEDTVAGVARPGTAEALAWLRVQGIQAILSLTEEPLPEALIGQCRIATSHVPLVDNAAPTLNQIERAVSSIDDFVAAGLPVAVHCAAGLGRTGTILACFLVQEGTDSVIAVAAVRERQPGSIETAEQEEAVWRYERHLIGQRSGDSNTDCLEERR